MDIIAMAREFAKSLQTTELYKQLEEAKKACDADDALQELIGQFNLLAFAAEREEQKEGGDENKLSQLSEQMQDIYNQVMGMPSMKKLDGIKMELDEAMNASVAIMAAAINGEDPETFDPFAQEEHHHCGGDCCTCGGCE